MVHAAGHGHAGLGTPVSQRGALWRWVGPERRNENAFLNGLALTGVFFCGTVIPVAATVVFVLAVLAVQDLRRNNDGRVGVEKLNLQTHDGQVLLLEGDHPLGRHPRAFARRGAPNEVAAQDAFAEVQDALVVFEVGAA